MKERSILVAVVLLCALLHGRAAVAQGRVPAPKPGASAAASAAPASSAQAEAEAGDEVVPTSPRERALMALPWQNGPTTGALGTIAEIKVPEGQMYLDGDGARRLLEIDQNPTSGRELGLVAAADMSWVMTFEFSEVAHVEDDETAPLDADKLLASLREGNATGNEARRSRGWETVSLVGWAMPPTYDAQSKNLEWATHVRNDTTMGVTVNHNIRLLGRSGVMEAGLLASPEDYGAGLAASKAMLPGFSFKVGQRYDEFREGDRIAEYGLTGLITGGALAVAAKSGFLAKAGKGIVKLVVVGGAAVAGLLSRLFGRKRASSDRE
ncbi:MAG: DUF2167 domain-containing protein [Polyangiaceae bacterium]